MTYLRIIGDVHGKTDEYLKLAQESNYSIQLGDLNIQSYKFLLVLDVKKHFVLGGNHDNYENQNGVFVNQTPHFLGDFGILKIPNISDIFFVRGGRSIDSSNRILGINYWYDEELSYTKSLQALNDYEKIKPAIVLTHECPSSIIERIARKKTWSGKEPRPSTTANLLQAMLEIHMPKLWIFGHHHIDAIIDIDKTKFVCVDILSNYDIEKGTI